jgi:hypothetical protein
VCFVQVQQDSVNILAHFYPGVAPKELFPKLAALWHSCLLSLDMSRLNRSPRLHPLFHFQKVKQKLTWLQERPSSPGGLPPSLPSPLLPSSLLRRSPLRTTTEIGVVTGSSSSLPAADNSPPVGVFPASRKRNLFPGDDKEVGDDDEEAMWLEGELFDDNILGLLSRKFPDNLRAGEGAEGSSAVPGVGLQEPSSPRKR